MKKNYTIRDIAHLAGVSKGTVDRVLHKRGKVSEVALEKVTKILNEIDYRPNPIAKNLKNNKVYTISILLPNPKIDSYWSPCIDGIKQAEDEFLNFGVKIEPYFFNPENTTSFSTQALEVIKSVPDAILMVPLFYTEAKHIVGLCDKAGIKVSTFNNFIDTSFSNNFIGQDLYKSGRVASKLFDQLLGKGHIGIVHIDEVFHNATHLQEKEKGFKSYFDDPAKNEFKISSINLKSDDPQEFNRAINNYLDGSPDINALFVTISKSYIIVDAIKHRPEKITIVGYDLIEKNVKYLLEGKIDFIIHQNPKKQVYLGLSYLAEYFLFDKEIPTQVLLPIDIINSENISGYLK